MKIKILSLLLLILVYYSGCVNKTENRITKIDITGNWQDEYGFPPYIQSREPALKNGKLKTFSQELTLPKGKYQILFEYDQLNDRPHGGIFENGNMVFQGFSVDGRACSLTFSVDSADKNIYRVYRAESELIIDDESKTIKLRLDIHNTRAMRTWISSSAIPATNNNYYALDPGKTGEYLIIRGIPFLARRTDFRQDAPWFQKTEPSLNAERGSLKIWDKGMTFNLEGTKTKKLHFLGMIHQVDIANGSWYSPKGDNGYSHFLGDKAGEIILTFKNNEKAVIPLIFGFNLWYSRPWDMFWAYFPTTPDSWSPGYNYDSTLFSGNQSYRDLIQNTVSLVDGMRLMGSKSNNTRFIFSLDLENRPVETIEIKGVDDMYGNPLISAITVETSEPSPTLSHLPELCKTSSGMKPVTLQYIKNEEYKQDLEKLKHVIYTYKNEMPKLQEPEIPEGYFGPRYNFKGTQEAVYAATYLYRNGPECGAKIADNGTRCASSIARKQTVHYTFGIGIWREEPSFSIYGNLQNWFRLYRAKSPGNFPGAGEAWSRGIGELTREAMALGYGKFINTYTDWLDSCLFAEASPPHWIRIVGAGSSYEGHEIRKVGKITETGNRENDGHGICMWGRYLTYHWLGHQSDWNEKHWKATKAAVDWIQWQLDTDTIFPGKRKDVLYTESECGNYEFYASYNCLHGLKLSIKMANELGKKEEAESWTKLYMRLQQGILDNVVDSSDFGPVWHTEPENNWHDDAQKMVHIQLASDGITYTPLQDYSCTDSTTQKYLKIDLNSYHYLMRDKNYNCLRSYGYGQGMMTQAALLLDEMKDAENFINLLVSHCYLPRLEGWTAPEGIIMHRSGEYWVPVNGYLGQDSHLADSQKALRLMFGLDDNNAENLRIIPRYPTSWNQMSISEVPVLTGSERQKISYTYLREKNRQVFKFGFERPVRKMSLRLGPIPEGRHIAYATLDDKKLSFENLFSGDSRWVWIKNLSGKTGKVIIYYQ
jgi:hypothetical protein